MKRLLQIIILLTFSICTFAQETKKDTIEEKENIQILKKDSTKLTDTLIFDISDVDSINFETAKEGKVKIVLVKEKSKADLLNYIFPILTLLLGIWVKHQLDKFSNRKRIKLSGERWIAELRSLEEPILKEVEALNEFKENTKEEESSIPKIIIYAPLNCEIFKSLDKNELLKYIELKNKKTDFKDIIKISNRTHGQVSILMGLYESLMTKFQLYLTNTSQHTESLSKCIQDFSAEFSNYSIEIEKEINKDPIHDDRYKPIAELYSQQILSHFDDGKFNPHTLENEFFKPIINILSNYRLDPKTKPLIEISRDALNRIREIKMEKTYIKEIAEDIANQYDNLLPKINDNINKMIKH